MRYLKFILMSSTSAFHKMMPKHNHQTAYDFKFETIEGNQLPLSKFKGKVLLVVNTASECGFTPQYEGLEKLWKELGNKGLMVIGIPSNDFAGQEPANEEEIKNFCIERFGVTFALTSKNVVTGASAHPFYKWTKEVLGNEPGWNFHKYLVGRDGRLVDYYTPFTRPKSGKLRKAIIRELEKVG